MSENDTEKKVADRYLKREVLGEGTYGVVYKAIDTKVTLRLYLYCILPVFAFIIGLIFFKIFLHK